MTDATAVPVVLTEVVDRIGTRELYFLNDKLTAQPADEWGIVSRVVPAAELTDHTMAIARRLLRTPASLLALVKGNLNQAEDDTERRRTLFAMESANQLVAVRDIAERMRRNAAPGT